MRVHDETGDMFLMLLRGEFAVPWADGVVVPLNTRWAAAEIVYALNDSNATLLLIDDRFLSMADAIKAEVRSLRAMTHMGDGFAPAGMVRYEELMERSDPIPDAARNGEDLAGIFYTGGTTGFPKGVMLPYRGLWASAMAGLSALGIEDDSVALHSAPMFHLADFGLTMAMLLAGAAHAIVPVFDPEQVLAAIARYRVTHALLVPTMIGMVVMHPNVMESDLSSLRMPTYGGSPIPEAILIETMRVLPGAAWPKLME